MSNTANFYCQNVCGDNDFSIDEWNKQFEICTALDIEMPKPEPCTKQCFDCMAIVGATRLKTQRLIEKQKQYGNN